MLLYVYMDVDHFQVANCCVSSYILFFAAAPCPNPDIPVHGKQVSAHTNAGTGVTTSVVVGCLTGYVTTDNTAKSCVRGRWIGSKVTCRCKSISFTLCAILKSLPLPVICPRLHHKYILSKRGNICIPKGVIWLMNNFYSADIVQRFYRISRAVSSRQNSLIRLPSLIWISIGNFPEA